MSRSRWQIQTAKTTPEVLDIVNGFLAKEGFTYKEYKGEPLWKKGSGWLTAPQFISVKYAPGSIFIEAWIRMAILPGVYLGESNLNGFFGFALKKFLKDRVGTLISFIQPINSVYNP